MPESKMFLAIFMLLTSVPWIAVTVCGVVLLFTQVIVVPTFTFTFRGPKQAGVQVAPAGGAPISIVTLFCLVISTGLPNCPVLSCATAVSYAVGFCDCIKFGTWLKPLGPLKPFCCR